MYNGTFSNFNSVLFRRNPMDLAQILQDSCYKIFSIILPKCFPCGLLILGLNPLSLVYLLIIRLHRGRYPLLEATKRNTVHMTLTKTNDFLPGILVVGAQDIILQMLNLDPKGRPSFEELKYHPWLAPPGLSRMPLNYQSMTLPSSSEFMGKACKTGKTFFMFHSILLVKVTFFLFQTFTTILVKKVDFH